MKTLTRITMNPEVMGGKPCIRGLRVTVGTIVGLIASGHSPETILQAYPYLEEADIYEALAYAAGYNCDYSSGGRAIAGLGEGAISEINK